ncbi:MAG: Holliday junction resolvase [Euryarchaeota archaeon]|nr:Holliday junction resolvase [Euryarchaeota archaeon]
MGKKGSNYERELKGILTGDAKVIAKMTKTMTEEERASYESTIKRPFMVLRAAGSLGIDLVVIRQDFSFPVEVKSSREEKLWFIQDSGRGQKQAVDMIKECERVGVVPIYAYRLKSVRGDPWRVFTLPMSVQLTGWSKYIYNLLPKLSTSRGGNFVMVWKEGMPLNKFLSYLNYEES